VGYLFFVGLYLVKPIKRFLPLSHWPYRSIRRNCPFCSRPVGKLPLSALPVLHRKLSVLCSRTCFNV